MVAHLGLSTDDLLYEEIGIIIAEILSASEKAECYEEVDNQSQCIYLEFKIIIFGFILCIWHNTLKNRKIIILN